jgi:hypothetical protein
VRLSTHVQGFCLGLHNESVFHQRYNIGQVSVTAHHGALHTRAHTHTYAVVVFTSALLLIRKLTASMLPQPAAKCKGVSPDYKHHRSRVSNIQPQYCIILVVVVVGVVQQHTVLCALTLQPFSRRTPSSRCCNVAFNNNPLAPQMYSMAFDFEVSTYVASPLKE